MKSLIAILPALILIGCTSEAKTVGSQPLTLTGEQLPVIRHVTEMKAAGDTLYFVYETDDNFGQRFLRSAVINRENGTLDIKPEIGKRDDGSYMSYMPYPFIADDRTVHVIGQDDCEIYAIENDTALVSTRQYLMDGNSTVPFPLSQYVSDLFMTAPGKYVFMGREPNGGRQFAMTADMPYSKIDIIRQVSISPELQSWMPNIGELAYSSKHHRLAFAYKLHPVVEIFGIDGSIIKSVRFGEDTFDPETLDKADFDRLNILHTVDVTCTPHCLIALHWAFKYDNATTTGPTIYKIDWNGRIIDRYFNTPAPIYRIAALDDSTLIAWTSTAFTLIHL